MKHVIKKRNIFVLLSIIIPLLAIGASNFFFAASSYRFILDPETSERMGRYWVGDIDGILMALTMCVVVVGVWFVACYYKWMDKWAERLAAKLSLCKKYIIGIENRKKLLKHAGILLSIIFGAIVIEWFNPVFIHRTLSESLNRMVFFASVGLSIYTLVVFRGKPEKLFFTLSLIIGTMYIAAHPMLFFGFDNEMHYAWAVEESFLFNVSVTESDYIVSRTLQMWSFRELPTGEYNAVVYSFPKGTSSLAWADEGVARNWLIRIAHLPMGLAIYFGRSLVLNPVFIVKLAMFVNHLMYTLVVYFAIRRLNSGKYLMAVIAMIPATFLVSASLGHGAWIKSFIMLGFAYCVYEIQNPEKKINLKAIVIMIAAFFIGLVPKSVYFPIMLILYFVRKDKFETEKGYRWYLVAVTGAIMLAIASFAVPFLIGGGDGAGDIRGGEGVNAMEQLMFILRNPFAYTMILLRFMRDYFNIFADGLNGGFIGWYISLGHFSFPNFTWVLIFFTAITDRCVKDKFTSTLWHKGLVIFITLSCVAIFSTAMYIAFTAVGSPYIAGVQGRYMIPLMFSFFYIACGFKIENNMNKVAYSIGIFAFMSFVLLSGAWNTFIP
ncbi:MAG: DUF2142 domain-containing protein [Oscillospiraceae bacterium]|nr:DUF2142 domain-containing protein [Oscillospiraceae bacterium]